MGIVFSVRGAHVADSLCALPSIKGKERRLRKLVAECRVTFCRTRRSSDNHRLFRVAGEGSLSRRSRRYVYDAHSLFATTRVCRAVTTESMLLTASFWPLRLSTARRRKKQTESSPLVTIEWSVNTPRVDVSYSCTRAASRKTNADFATQYHMVRFVLDVVVVCVYAFPRAKACICCFVCQICRWSLVALHIHTSNEVLPSRHQKQKRERQ